MPSHNKRIPTKLFFSNFNASRSNMLPSSTRRHCVAVLMLITGLSTCGTNGSESTFLTRRKRNVNAEEHMGLESYGTKHMDNLLPRSDSIAPKILDVVREHREGDNDGGHIRMERASSFNRNMLARRKIKKQLERKRLNMDQEDSIRPILKLNKPFDHHKLVGMLNGVVHPIRHIKQSTQNPSSRSSGYKGKMMKKQKQKIVGNERKPRLLTETTLANDISPTSTVYLQSPTPLPSTSPPVRDVTPITREQTAVPKRKYERSHTYKQNRPYSKSFANPERSRSSVVIPELKMATPTTKSLSNQGRSHPDREILSDSSNASEMILPSFPLRNLFSFRNITVLNSSRERLDLIDEEKSRQVILLSEMFNKSLSETWKLLIPHPKLSSSQKNKTKSTGVFHNHMDDEIWISLMSSQNVKIKKKKASAYTESDYRPSAIGIGSVGALVLVAIVVGIIILDSSSLYRDAKRLKRCIFSLCRPVYKHKLTASTTDTNGQKWAYVIHERYV